MGHSKFSIQWRYAIGEFLIVVLGIIAAFQLDSWKEHRDDARLLKEYLTDIEAGLQSDSIYFVYAKRYFEGMELSIDSTENFLNEKVYLLPPSGYKSLQDFSAWYQLYIMNAAFQDLNNSGGLNLIQDKELRYNLLSYYQYTELIKQLDEEYRLSLARMKETLLMHLDFRNPATVEIARKDLPLLLNYLDQKRSYMYNYMSHRNTCQEINNGVRAQIRSKLATK